MISEDESAKYMELLFEPKHELNIWKNSKPTSINLETFASSYSCLKLSKKNWTWFACLTYFSLNFKSYIYIYIYII